MQHTESYPDQGSDPFFLHWMCRVLTSGLPAKSLIGIGIYIYILLIYFWLHWVFIAAHGLSLVAVSRGYSLVAVNMFLLLVASPVTGMWVLEHRPEVAAHGLT